MIDNRHRDGADVVAFMTWAEGIKERYSDHPKPGAWSRRRMCKEEFRWSAGRGDTDGGILSPKLWEQEVNSTPHSPNISLPPTSRAVAIAGYQREMMELVRHAPETAYELSLRDIVEMPRREEGVEVLKAAKKVVARRMSRSESMGSGVFVLNLFFPFSFGGKKRRRSSGSSGCSSGSKVLPRPVKGGGERTCSDGDWRSKSGWSSSSGRSFSSSGSSSINSSVSRKSTCCYTFLAHKIKAAI